MARFRELAGRRDDVEVRHQLAWAYTRLGGLYWDTGRKEDARAAWNEALSIRERLAAEEGGNHGVALAGVLEVVAGKQDTLDQSRRLHLRALVLREQYAAEEPGDLKRQGQLAFSYQNLGMVAGNEDQFEKALEWFEKAREIWQKCVAAFPDEVRYQTELAKTLTDIGEAHQLIGDALTEKGRAEDAARARQKGLAARQQACDIRAAVMRAHPENFKNQDTLIEQLELLGAARSDLREHAAAVATFQQACAVREHLLAMQTPPILRGLKEKLATAYEALATEQEKAGQPEEAARTRQKARTLRANSPGD